MDLGLERDGLWAVRRREGMNDKTSIVRNRTVVHKVDERQKKYCS
ncbi:hypothetical protein [Metabacillus litoralis]|nr:hypothetical protein [Metabacillus litoralis]